MLVGGKSSNNDEAGFIFPLCILYLCCQYIRQGGAKVATQEESSLSTGLKVAMGKAEFVDLMGPSEAEKKETRGKQEEEIERCFHVCCFGLVI